MSPGSACQRCRKRHIKCDGTRPSCQQCASAKHDCPGYSEDWKFINNGAKLPPKRQKRQSPRPYKASRSEEFAGPIKKRPVTQIHADAAPEPDHFGASGPGPEASPELLSSGSGNDFEIGFAALASEFMLESEQEMVFLLRHYTDNLAPWLDIFGDNRFFQTRTPRLVGSHSAIKYAIAALAAKHLSHVGGFRPTHSCVRSNLALTELYPSAVHVDWAFKAANYHHQATTNLPLQNVGESALREAGSLTLAEVAMASNAILTTYDMLDSNWDELQTRIHNIKSGLVRPPNKSSSPDSKFAPSKSYGSPAALASFWHCMPHDLLISYDQKQTPSLDLKALHISNLVVSSIGSDDARESTNMARTPWAHLFLLVSQIINKFTATPNSSDGGTKSAEHSSWSNLWDALDQWHTQLDLHFQPYSHYMLSSHLTLSQGPMEPIFDEILFPTAVSAATLSYYHFARVLLLLAKPIDQSNPLVQLKDYRERLLDIKDNCVKICGIAASRPGPAARIHLVHPLFLAGQCLEEPREREAVVQLLQDIEADTGWPTASQVRRLHQEWYSNPQER
ncbi:hypothetical protein TgHK011_001548 [Trichoderma gracile]|nr:hypothetical protein TgHK011_001548 [Trichoderma gracile]